MFCCRCLKKIIFWTVGRPAPLKSSESQDIVKNACSTRDKPLILVQEKLTILRCWEAKLAWDTIESSVPILPACAVVCLAKKPLPYPTLEQVKGQPILSPLLKAPFNMGSQFPRVPSRAYLAPVSWRLCYSMAVNPFVSGGPSAF